MAKAGDRDDAYMINVVKAHQEYEGLAWFLNDEAYHRQAVATGRRVV